MNRIKWLTFLIFTLLSCICRAQSYKFVNVETSDFPIVEASILAVDSNFNPEDFDINSVSILENGEVISPLSSKAPVSRLEAIPLSLVFALDISGSMFGQKFEILKASTKKIIKIIPLDVSEVAIASFNHEIALNCDFTHNLDTLLHSIDCLRSGGGTNFENAFLADYAGLVDIAKQGQYENKLIIFISDGMGKLNAQQVTDLANSNLITVNCITIDVPISEDLKIISNQTGGDYYSDIQSEKEIDFAFNKIYHKSQENRFGKIKWKSNYSCNPEKSTQLSIGHQKIAFQYQIPDEKVGKIEVSPTNVSFDNQPNETILFRPVFIKGQNVDLNITSVENNNPDFFGIKPIPLPITASANELKMLELSFSPKDSIRASTEYIIKSKGCPDVTINASSEGRDKLLITYPKGGEEYVRGATVPITWKGIAELRTVDFYYQIKGEDTWNSIGSGTLHQKCWNPIAINDSIRIKGIISGNITFDNLIVSPVAIFDSTSFQSAYYNKSGSEILSLSANGTLRSWDANSGKLKNTFEHPIEGDYSYIPGFNRIINVTPHYIKVFTNRNGLLMKELPVHEQKNLTSLTHVNDKELYVSLSNFNAILNELNSKYLDITSSPITKYSIARDKSKLHILKEGKSKKEFSIKLDTSFQKSVLHRNKAILAVINTNTTQLYNLKTKSLELDLPGERFYQFSSCSRYVVTQDSLNYNIYYLANWHRVYSLPKLNQFTLSPINPLIAKVVNDSLFITDMSTRQIIWSKLYKGITQYQFFPKSNRFLFLHKDSLVILDLYNKKVLTKVKYQADLIKMISISPDEKLILVTCDNVIAALNMENLLKTSGLGIEEQPDTDITTYFSIISPEPEIVNRITFPKQYVNTFVEKVFNNIITNPGSHTVYIDSVYVESNNSCFSLVSSPDGFPVEPSGQSSLEIRFFPKMTGVNTGKLVIVSGNKKYSCELEGEGMEQGFEILSPQVNFQAIMVYSSADTIVPLIKNTGSELLSINNIRLNPDNQRDFSIVPITHNKILSPNDTLWTKISFSPTSRGRQNVLIQVQPGNMDWVKSSMVYGEGLAKRKVIIAGKTVHAISKKPLGSLINLTELDSGKTVYQGHYQGQGFFSIMANADLNYSIDAFLEGYFSSSENINLTSVQFSDTLWVHLELMPINQSSTIQLKNIFFDTGKAELLDISKTELLRIVAFMNKQKNLKIEVHGHTDNIGNTDSNDELSKLRALAVKAFITQHGISKERIFIRYFGESQPIDDNNSEKGRKANRRVEILFVQ